MSPRKFLEGDHKQNMKSGSVAINGPRPSPLKLKQESHTIQKQHNHPQQIKKPIIIYTYSPEVIHAKPHDFMALVQKLTGVSASKDQERRPKTLKKDRCDHRKEDDEFSNDSGVTRVRNIPNIKSKSPMFDAPPNRYMADMPLFTPNYSSDYFCSPRPLFRFNDMVSSSPNMTTSLSPGSLVELMKILPEY